MKAQVISFRCILKNTLGRILSTSFNQNVLTVGEVEGIPLKRLTEGLQNLREGERRKIFIPADQAYGFYQLEKLRRVALEQITDSLKVGEWVRLEEEPTLYRVVDLDGEFATLDANHPLAGQDLIFEIEATRVRVATPDEMSDVQESSPSAAYH